MSLEKLIDKFDLEIIKKKTMDNKERLNQLYKDYKLTKDDYFNHKHYTIITRSGIDKIQSMCNIKITYQLIYHSPDCLVAIIKAKGRKGDTEIETYGEVNPKNNSNAYPISMAEKRAMSRIVLKIAGFYELNTFGEDEAEEFKKSKNK